MGGSLTCVSKVDKASPERKALEKVYDWLISMEPKSEVAHVEIPIEKYEGCVKYIKDTLSGGVDQRTRMASHSKTVNILNNKSTTPTTLFVKRLQYDLGKLHAIKANIIETLDDVQIQHGTKFVLVCNISEGGSIRYAAATCLKDLARNLYRSTILIVLHVMRPDKLPRLSSRGELLGNKDFNEIGRVIDMGFSDGEIYSCERNESAFKEMRHFFSEPVSIQPKAYIINPSNANAANGFVKAFKERMLEYGICLCQRNISELDQLDPSLILIVVCNNVSRIDSDIEECLDPKIRAVDNKQILIVLHVDRKGREPNDHTKNKLNNSPYLENYFHSIIDIAFSEDDGIYECVMNEKALAALKRIDLDNHLHRGRSSNGMSPN